MAGIMNKIGDAQHIGGGNKEGDEHKEEEEKKEGIIDKIKDKVSGGEKSEKDGEKKKDGDGHEKKKKKDHGGSDSHSNFVRFVLETAEAIKYVGPGKSK